MRSNIKSVVLLAVLTLGLNASSLSCGAADFQLEGSRYIQERNFPKALACFNAALKEHPDSWMLRQNIGNCQMELGHYDTATASFQKSIEVGGLHASQCTNLAAVYQRSGQPKQALNWLKLACSIDPTKAADPLMQANISKHTEMLVKTDNSPGPTNLVVLVKDGPAAPVFRDRNLVMLCCLHEVGHALGMHGHSPSSLDVMFPAVTPGLKAKLSERDKNTMKRIYQKGHM